MLTPAPFSKATLSFFVSPLLAGADVREMPFTTDGDFIGALRDGWEYSWPKPRVVVLSFPHNPPRRAWTSTS